MSINVLWVEDEPSSMRYEQQLAKNEGWAITFADTVSEALELIREKDFDLIVVDLIMPMDDFEKKRGYANPESGTRLVKDITNSGREGRTQPNVPILVITAMGQEDGREVIKELPTTRYYINKPIVDIDGYCKVLKELTQKVQCSLARSN